MTGINFYLIHYDDGINYTDMPLFNRELIDIPLYISTFENSEHIYVLESYDINYPDLLLIGSYYQDDLWIIMILSLQDSNFIEWGMQ